MKKTINSKEYKIFLKQLYQLRTAQGMRQEDLAVKLDLPQSFVSKIESGERRLDILELRQILRFLNTDLTEFVIELEKKINDSR